MFNFSNVLFSGFAFAGFLIAIYLQNQELKLQRDELSLTRKEMEGQKEQLKAQNNTFKKQTFENTFFQMLNLHNNIVESMFYDKDFKGRKVFDILLSKLINDSPNPKKLEVILTHYEKILYVRFDSILGHYFRNLFNIINFIDKSNIDDKYLYVKLVRAQLSQNELVFLYFNCQTKYGKDKFKPLVETYHLLKNMNNTAKNLFIKDSLFDKSAFEHLEK